MLPPRTAGPSKLAHSRCSANSGACARRRAGAHPIATQVNACNCIVHTDLDLPLSRRRRCPRRRLVTARASRCYPPSPIHTPVVSHLCLSSFHSPRGGRLPLASTGHPAQPLSCCLTCQRPPGGHTPWAGHSRPCAPGSNHSDLGAVCK